MLGHGTLGEFALGETEGDGVGGNTISNAGAVTSAEAFGTPAVLSDAYVITAAGGIASAEAFGTPQLNEDRLVVTEIASAEAFGTPSLILVLSPTSIDSAENVPSQRVAELVTYLPVSRIL